MTPLIAGNWKMHKLPSEAVAWAEALLEQLTSTPHDHVELLLNVPATHLAPLRAVTEGAVVRLGGQDLSAHESGAYTGEISGAMLRDAGADYVVVGHSERRAYHREDDTLVHAKVVAALAQGLRPILCVGESEAEREAGRAAEVVLAQLAIDLDGVAPGDPAELVVAYEPIWAIGTGKTATADDAQEMSATIRSDLRARYGDDARKMRILYGGSMKPGNAAELLARPDIDGGLIGGASLDIEALLAIVGAAR
jgi:triosephosphate isomerase